MKITLYVCLLAPALALAQAPRLGDIETYGIRKVSRQRILSVVGVKAGDPLPGSKGEIEDRLEKISGVVLARLEAVCCEDDKAILFVGIEERGAPHFALHAPPAGDTVLPPEIVAKYRKQVQAVEAAARRGVTAEDLTQGHALMADVETRAIQQEFTPWAAANLALLRNVLRNSAEDEHREIAAAIIGYAPDKTKVVDDLEYAMQDPDEAVRANAMRALGAIGVLAVRDPSLGIRIPATWLVEMLNSIVLSDRVRASTALAYLTEKDASSILEQIRGRALAAVIEMARWNSLQYALPPFLLAGRVAGMTEQEIQDAWKRGDRESVLKRALKGAR